MSHPELVEQIRESLAEMADGKSEVLTKDEILANHRADAYR